MRHDGGGEGGEEGRDGGDTSGYVFHGLIILLVNHTPR